MGTALYFDDVLQARQDISGHRYELYSSSCEGGLVRKVRIEDEEVLESERWRDYQDAEFTFNQATSAPARMCGHSASPLLNISDTLSMIEKGFGK